MSNATYYVQECPTCGRRLQVRVWYLGKKVACQHCGAHFFASDPDGEPVGAADGELSGLALLQKADQLLATIEAKRRA